MNKQTIMWTALPHGFAEGHVGLTSSGKLRITAYISPQLISSTPVLSQFPDFVHWPHTVQGLHFKVQFGNGAPLTARRVSDDPDPDLWAALFPPETTVEAYNFSSPGNLRITSFPASAVLADVKSRHQDMVKAIKSTPSHFAPARSFLSIYNDLHIDRSTHTKLSRALLSTLAQHRVVVPAANLRFYRSTTPVDTLLHSPTGIHFQVQNFYSRALSPKVSSAPKPLPSAAQLKTMYDFHQMVSVLGNYPLLLVKLGLAIELEVDYHPGIPASGFVRILPSRFAQTPNVHPWTFYSLNTTSFIAAPRPHANQGQGSDLRDGLLLLGDPSRFEIAHVDIDGASLKLQTAATTAATALQTTGIAFAPATRYQSQAAAEGSSIPSMRTGGMSLLHIGRAAALLDSFNNATQQHQAAQSNQPVQLYADDLVRGYAVDVLDESTGIWRSLCMRDGTYQFVRAPQGKKTLTLPDEGFVTMGTTHDPQASPNDLYLHEQIFRWDGWSLSAPRPIQPLDQEGNAFSHADNPNTNPDPNITQFGFAASFTASNGSLPRLRFGHTYRMRARMVDLAGNRVPLDATEAALPAVQSPATRYQRWEPIVAPAVSLRASIKGSPGESVNRLVVRSDFDKTVEEYFAAQSAPTFNKYAERHFLPPKTSQTMAEQHGMFDGPLPPDTPSGKEWYDIIVERDVSLPQDSNPPYTPTPQDVDHLPLPYLPDPLAAGVTFVGLPGGQIVQIPLATGPWPEFSTFRLLVKGIQDGQTPAAPAFDATKLLLTVEIAQGDMITGRYSSHFPPEALGLLGVWSWTVDAGVTKYKAAPITKLQTLYPTSKLRSTVNKPHAIFTAPPPKLWNQVTGKPWLIQVEAHKSWDTVANQSWQTATLLGTAWMFTPYREITLVHAVQRPLIKPQFSSHFAAQRDLGSTHAVLVDHAMPISGKSTVEMDIQAQWYEPIDDLSQPAPAIQAHHAHVSKLPIGIGDTLVQFPTDGPPYNSTLDKRFWHVFNDTRYRRVAYTAIATSRFREYFFADNDPTLLADPSLITRSSDTATLVTLNAEHPVVPDFSHPLPSGVIDIPNSARPPSPRVLYVVPTFGHQTAVSAAGALGTERIGGGLRVYLERPWYASGDGELLGVILPAERSLVRIPIKIKSLLASAAAVATPSNALDPSHYTQWGLDPIWRSRNAPAPFYPSLESFTNAARLGNNLSIDEQPGAKVSVAGHLVNYDETRRLWYCDIILDPGQAYYPFIRLALARYQPNSVQDAHLSRIIVADFIQLAPNRLAVVTLNASAPNRLAIAVTGPTPVRTNNLVTITLERQLGSDQDSDPDLNWVPVPNATQQLIAEPTANGSIWQTREFTIPQLAQPLPPLRLVIREYEQFNGSNAQGLAAEIANVAPVTLQRRLVYAEIIEVAIPE